MPKYTVSPPSPVLAMVAAALNASLGKADRIKLAEQPADAGAPASIPVLTHDGGSVVGVLGAAAFMVEESGVGGGLLGCGEEEQAAVAGWVTFMEGASGEDVAFVLNAHLTLRSFVVGYAPTVADMALWWRVPQKIDAGALPYVARWAAVLGEEAAFAPGVKAKKKAAKEAAKAAKAAKNAAKGGKKGKKPVDVNKPIEERLADAEAALAALEAAAAAGGDGAPSVGELKKARGVLASLQKKCEAAASEGSYMELKGAVDGQVKTRFPPEPSGYLHIGHTKAAMLNAFYAKKYHGKLLLRFDDTNPSKETDEFVDAIITDLATLGIEADEVSHTSDHFETIQAFARQLIEKGLGYVDNTPVDQMREERMARVESAARSNSVETNLELWEHMLAGDEVGVECCLRGKIDMSANNACMRDPVFYRCNATPHLRTKDKYKAYPTYDFACPIVDSIEGVTHALRTNEYHDRNEQFAWVCHALEIREPAVDEYSRLNFQYTVMSKRKLQWFVDQGIVEGWFDPRFPTVQGIMRRGLTLEALWDFIATQGSSLKANTHSWDKLWALNKKVIDPVVPRHVAIPAAATVALHLTNVGGVSVETKDAHPKNPDVGTKQVVYSSDVWVEAEDAARVAVGEEVTLVTWGNAVVTAIEKDESGAVVRLVGELNLAGDPSATAVKMTWLTAAPGFSVEVDLVEYDHMITKSHLDRADNVADFVRAESRFVTRAVCDAGVAALPVGARLQFMRRGYFRVDRVLAGSDGAVLELIMIPDGKEAKGSVLTSKVDLEV